MSDMRYSEDDLRTGGASAALAADAATRAATALRIGRAASPFGRTATADALHGAVVTAREHHGVAAARSGTALRDAAGRAVATAALGHDATAATSATAAGITAPGAAAVSGGM